MRTCRRHELDPRGDQEADEGCLSLPGLYFPVKRAMRVRVARFELDGTPVAFEAEEFPARILQHETDHVNGILSINPRVGSHVACSAM